MNYSSLCESPWPSSFHLSRHGLRSLSLMLWCIGIVVSTGSLATVFGQVSLVTVPNQTANLSIRHNVVILSAILLQRHKDPVTIVLSIDGNRQLRSAFFSADTVPGAARKYDYSPNHAAAPVCQFPGERLVFT